MDPSPAPVGLFRWSGPLWRFREGDRLFDRYGRQIGGIRPGPAQSIDVFDVSGRFLGALVDDHYVLRPLLRGEPVHLAPRPPLTHPAPPLPPLGRDPRTPLDDWSDARPWPLLPPDPPAR
jgi:hypothetical protein